MRRQRVAILHQGCVPTYRKSFFERLARESRNEYVVFHGRPDPAINVTPAELPYNFPNRHVANGFIKVFGRTFAFQSAIFAVLVGRYDALVIGHEIKYVTSLLLALCFNLTGRPVILWGHGNTRDLEGTFGGRQQQRLSRLVERVKAGMIRHAAGYMAYSTSGADYVLRAGMPRDRITVLLNTIDMSSEIAAHGRWQKVPQAEVRNRLGLGTGSIVYTFLGRMVALKRAGLLLAIARDLRAEGLPIEVVLVGNGGDEQKLRGEFQSERWCHFMGAIFDGERIAEIMRASDAIVVPDYIGLAINHGFAHGLPVITMRSAIHGPEIDYLESEYNGVIADGVDGLRGELRRFATHPDLRAEVSKGALASRQKFDILNMVKAFDGAIEAALRVTR